MPLGLCRKSFTVVDSVSKLITWRVWENIKIIPGSYSTRALRKIQLEGEDLGYTTEFKGSFSISPPLQKEQAEYINQFSSSRRMKRDASQCEKFKNPLRKDLALPVGIDGGYFTGEEELESRDDSILDYNKPPEGQPGLWCQWRVTSDGTRIEWDGGEKFYFYKEWLRYLIKHFFSRWKRTVNGRVTWQGEDESDKGELICIDNAVVATSGL